MKSTQTLTAVTIAISIVGCSSPSVLDSGSSVSVPNLEICASVTDQYARRGSYNFDPNGNGEIEARAIFYRAKLNATNGATDRQIAMWANQGEDPLLVQSLDQTSQQAMLRRCEAAFETQPMILPVDDQEAAQTCYVAATFIRSLDLTDLIMRRYDVKEGPLGSITRASAKQSRDHADTFFYLDTLGNALKTEPLNRTVDNCLRRFKLS